MALYYLPVLIRSDRYFVARLENNGNSEPLTDFNFTIPADDRVLTPLLSIEDPGKIVLNQMAPSERQDVPLRECHISLHRYEKGYELLIRPQGSFVVEPFEDRETGLRLDYSPEQKRVLLGFYHNRVETVAFELTIRYCYDTHESYAGKLDFSVVRSRECHRVVIDFGSEASQVGYRNCGPQPSLVQYDILGNIISQLQLAPGRPERKREDFLNYETGQPSLYRSFYAVKKNLSPGQRSGFPFNFTNDLANDEIRLFITKQEVAATQYAFRDNYEIIPNLKLGIEKSLQLHWGSQTEDYSIRSHKKELISAVLLRLLRLMIRTKPDFRSGGLIVTLLVPNIYTQHDIFELLNALRVHTRPLLDSLQGEAGDLHIEYETISESDAAFMGYQQTHASEVNLSNGDIALVIDCGKGTTDISMLLADDNENYSSFFRTGFAGAGNVLLYAFAEDFLQLVLNAIPGHNDISVKDFIRRQMLEQNLTADTLNFIQLMEEYKKRHSLLQPVGLESFAALTEDSLSTERSIGNLHKDPSTLLRYAEAILQGRGIRWDDEITGIIHKATDCLVHAMLSGIRDVMTRDIRKRVRVVMLSGRAFYFEELRTKLEKELGLLLGGGVPVKTVPAGRALNNKNVAVHGAFSGAYKITDFTGIPVDRKEGLSRNNDVLNNNMFLYRGIKVEPGNDIRYNDAVIRRNNQELKSFKNKTVDIYFTRDNIYLRLMENQRVKDVRSLYSLLSAVGETFSPVQDLRMLSMFPSCTGELASVAEIYADITKEKNSQPVKPARKKQGILHFFQL